MYLPQFTFMSSAPSDSPLADTYPDVLEPATLFSYPEEMEDCCVLCDPETDSNGNTLHTLECNYRPRTKYMITRNEKAGDAHIEVWLCDNHSDTVKNHKTDSTKPSGWDWWDVVDSLCGLFNKGSPNINIV